MYVGIVPTIFGNSVSQASPRVAHAERRCAGVCSLTRGNLAARHADCARLVDSSGKNGWQEIDGPQRGQVHPGVDLAGRGSGPTVVRRANMATLFSWVPDSGWPLPLSKRTGWQNGGKMPQKGGKMATFAGKGYVTGYVATPLLSCGCVNCRRMSAERRLATTIYSSRSCVKNLVSPIFEKAEKRSIS